MSNLLANDLLGREVRMSRVHGHIRAAWIDADGDLALLIEPRDRDRPLTIWHVIVGNEGPEHLVHMLPRRR